MVKRRIQLRNISTVAASKTAVIDLPIGPRYHKVIIAHGYTAGSNTIAAAATNISWIRVKVNGRIQRIVTGTELRDANILNGTIFDCTGSPNGTAPDCVQFPIFFAEPWRFDAKDQDALAWPSNAFSSFQIEVELGAAGTPTLSAYAIVDDLQVQGNPGIVKWMRQTFGASGTSFDISTLDRRDWLQQISLYPDGSSNQATKVTLRKDGQILHELPFPANFSELSNSWMYPTASGRTAKIYDLVLDSDGLLGSAVNLDGARDLTLTVEAGGSMSGTVTAIITRLGTLE